MIVFRYPDLRRWFAVTPGTLAPDGHPVWPGPMNADGSVSNAGASKLRAAGFTSLAAMTAGGHTFSGQPTAGPLVDPSKIPEGDGFWPLAITCNAGAADPGVEQDQFVWYFSARGDVVRRPDVNHPTSIQAAHAPIVFAVDHADRQHSGTIYITPIGSEVGKLFPGQTSAPIDAASLSTLFRHCAIYVSRLSDHAYQWATIVAE